jgi:hypothetical protein
VDAERKHTKYQGPLDWYLQTTFVFTLIQRAAEIVKEFNLLPSLA